MSPIKRFSLVVIFILSLMSCSDSKTSYYRTWQEGHHLSDSLMVDFYGTYPLRRGSPHGC